LDEATSALDALSAKLGKDINREREEDRENGETKKIKGKRRAWFDVQ